MNLINHTPFAAELTTRHDGQGRECLLLVVKATYALPAHRGVPAIAAIQQPIHFADTATGEPGRSAPVYESDLCPPKPRVDVLLIGSAYAPQGQPADRVPVGLAVGDLRKGFVVTGPRHWVHSVLGQPLSAPQPFVRQAISYDIAFGGTLPGEAPGAEDQVFDANPVGRGFRPAARWPEHTPGPQTEATHAPIASAHGRYAPMAFGPLGRHWLPRRSHAGTYDDAWRERRYPFLPEDFDPRYFQAAPEDQQLPALRGGETVRLLNLCPPTHTAQDLLEFTLPDLSLPVRLHGRSGVEAPTPVADTLLIEPDAQRFSITWKVDRPLGNDPYRFHRVEVGDRPKGLLVRIPLEVLAGELPSRQGLQGPGGRI